MRFVTLWLFTCCGMIFVMALLGAVTRLTESGLSITDWAPVTGILPPLDKAGWDKAFSAYQQIPQYQLLHRGMSLAEFKNIYFWEWLHRLWGRLIGVVFAVPLIVFFLRGKISKNLGLKLLGILALGGLQGFIGWYMVMSGLAARTSVSPYRLALHLGFALLIYAAIFWTALDLSGMRKIPASGSLRRHGWVALGFLAITIVWGAFTAGLHAGEAYNTWPLMEGEFFPSAALTILPKWHNAFENLALVQFMHRWLGPATMLVILSWVSRCLNFLRHPREGGGPSLAQKMDGRLRGHDAKWLYALGLMALLQVALGMTTLLTHAEIIVAVTHQAGAIVLLTFLLINLHKTTDDGRQRIRNN